MCIDCDASIQVELDELRLASGFGYADPQVGPCVQQRGNHFRIACSERPPLLLDGIGLAGQLHVSVGLTTSAKRFPKCTDVARFNR